VSAEPVAPARVSLAGAMPPAVVLKFGGTSVRDGEGRRRAVAEVARAVAEGLRPVVVVSAMGRLGDPYATDTLLALLDGEAADVPVPARDVDLLVSCGEVIAAVVLAAALRAEGVAAAPLTGAQAGVITDGQHLDAKIVEVRTQAVERHLADGVVPVVTGFQGVAADGEITTLGRGGSDTTAAALGASLGAVEVRIYTDVDGLKTADPRLVPEARTIAHLDYAETFELAQQGAKVLHPRAVEIARQAGVTLRVGAPGQGAGTVIGSARGLRDVWAHRRTFRAVVGVTCRVNLGQVAVDGAGEDGVDARALFRRFADAKLSVDLINVFPDRISFVVSADRLREAHAILDAVVRPPWRARVRSGLGKVAIVGSAIHGLPGVMAVFMEALAEAGAEVLATSDSHQSIAALVREEEVPDAVRAVHRAFHLDGLTEEVGRR
jgi:aspartate kinase